MNQNQQPTNSNQQIKSALSIDFPTLSAQSVTIYRYTGRNSPPYNPFCTIGHMELVAERGAAEPYLLHGAARSVYQLWRPAPLTPKHPHSFLALSKHSLPKWKAHNDQFKWIKWNHALLKWRSQLADFHLPTIVKEGYYHNSNTSVLIIAYLYKGSSPSMDQNLPLAIIHFNYTTIKQATNSLLAIQQLCARITEILAQDTSSQSYDNQKSTSIDDLRLALRVGEDQTNRALIARHAAYRISHIIGRDDDQVDIVFPTGSRVYQILRPRHYLSDPGLTTQTQRSLRDHELPTQYDAEVVEDTESLTSKAISQVRIILGSPDFSKLKSSDKQIGGRESGIHTRSVLLLPIELHDEVEMLVRVASPTPNKYKANLLPPLRELQRELTSLLREEDDFRVERNYFRQAVLRERIATAPTIEHAWVEAIKLLESESLTVFSILHNDLSKSNWAKQLCAYRSYIYWPKFEESISILRDDLNICTNLFEDDNAVNLVSSFQTSLLAIEKTKVHRTTREGEAWENQLPDGIAIEFDEASSNGSILCDSIMRIWAMCKSKDAIPKPTGSRLQAAFTEHKISYKSFIENNKYVKPYIRESYLLSRALVRWSRIVYDFLDSLLTTSRPIRDSGFTAKLIDLNREHLMATRTTSDQSGQGTSPAISSIFINHFLQEPWELPEAYLQAWTKVQLPLAKQGESPNSSNTAQSLEWNWTTSDYNSLIELARQSPPPDRQHLLNVIRKLAFVSGGWVRNSIRCTGNARDSEEQSSLVGFKLEEGKSRPVLRLFKHCDKPVPSLEYPRPFGLTSSIGLVVDFPEEGFTQVMWFECGNHKRLHWTERSDLTSLPSLIRTAALREAKSIGNLYYTHAAKKLLEKSDGDTFPIWPTSSLDRKKFSGFPITPAQFSSFLFLKGAAEAAVYRTQLSSCRRGLCNISVDTLVFALAKDSLRGATMISEAARDRFRSGVPETLIPVIRNWLVNCEEADALEQKLDFHKGDIILESSCSLLQSEFPDPPWTIFYSQLGQPSFSLRKSRGWALAKRLFPALEVQVIKKDGRKVVTFRIPIE